MGIDSKAIKSTITNQSITFISIASPIRSAPAANAARRTGGPYGWLISLPLSDPSSITFLANLRALGV
jgi:hypothetical protein